MDKGRHKILSMLEDNDLSDNKCKEWFQDII